MRDMIIVGLVGAGTLAMRALYLVGLGGVTLSERSERWLGHAKPAILAALVGGFLAGGEAGITLGSAAGVAAAWAVARTGRGMLTVLASGMAATLLLSL